MASETHNGFLTSGDVIGESGTYGRFTGHRLIKVVTIEGRTYWIVRYVELNDRTGEELHKGSSLGLTLQGDLLKEKWVKPDLSPSKGDILRGVDKNGNAVYLVFENLETVHRISAMAGSSREVSSAGLSYYERNLSDVQIVTTSYSQGTKKFSDL